MVTFFLIITILLFLLGVPLGITIGFSSMIYIMLADITPMIIIQRLFTGIDVSSLMAIPFFILAGNIMLTGGLAQRMIDLANSFIGRSTGGLALVTILGCMFFAAISGSAVATAAALSTLMVPAMVKKGYDHDFAASVVSTASPMGVIIPPSVTLIIYGSLSGSSISDLYTAGIPAGIIVGSALLIVTYFISKKKDYKGTGEPFQIKEFGTSLFRALWALGTPVILIGGVFSGIFTPTESGVAAVIYAVIIGMFMYRELSFKQLITVFFDSAKTTATIMFIITNASLFAFILAYENIPSMLVSGFLSMSDNPVFILLIINIILLIFGMFLDTIAILVIVVPMFLPVIDALNIDPVFFGIVVIINTAIGMCTPPFGGTLLVTTDTTKVPLVQLSSRSLFSIGALVVALLIVTYFPYTVMFPLW
ncbi:TRAP transporter large permease [Thalassobacillus sp. CUG 92003]|uniref:TRAP transporter large permease n=1 Tax=Thalassobacillus sp. CUG 92003 TaxID=2736641 RepID=UPI0015E71624|nr:TRAP transporter large permease [Thalassobacillus sp. CUG 92003]